MRPLYLSALFLMLMTGCRAPQCVQDSWSYVRHSRVVEGVIGEAEDLGEAVREDLNIAKNKADGLTDEAKAKFDEAMQRSKDAGNRAKDTGKDVWSDLKDSAEKKTVPRF